MSPQASQRLEDKGNQPSPASLANLQPMTWGFTRINSNRVVLGVPPIPDEHSRAENERRISEELEVSKSSLTDSSYHEEEGTETQDTEMLDVSEPAGRSLSSGTTKSPTQKKTLPGKDDTVVFVDDDGDIIEMTRSTSSKADSRGPITEQTRIPWGNSSDSLRLHTARNSAAGLLDNRSYGQNHTQPRRKADQDKGKITAYMSPKPLGEEPEVRIMDAAIARHFHCYRKLDICSGDYLDDAALAEWLKETSPGPKQHINEDDEAVVEDFIEEESLVDHLRSLVISPPEETSPTLQRYVRQPLNVEIHPAKPKESDLHIGVTVELYNGSFLWIDSVRRDIWGLVKIRGYRLARDTYCGSKLPDGRLNELVWVNEVDEPGYKAGEESVLQEERFSDVKRIREVIYTNCPWPEISYYGELQEQGSNETTVNHAAVKETGNLYCRWKYIQVNSRLKTDAEACLRLLNDNEAKDIGRLVASEVRKNWHGGEGPIPGGSSTKPVFDVEAGKVTSHVPQYTLGDCFCGAGGISRGATQAGLQVAWGFDSDGDAIETHSKNFGEYGTESLEMDDAQFIDLTKARPRQYGVDVAHYSPPCQPFSSANHNRNEERDFKNQKALFSLSHLTMHLKPRIATIEETAGLMHRHQQWFDALINTFTGIGYGVRWKIIRCQEYGIPQSRVRLLLIAAA